jgi:hypothetical protein
MWFSDLVWENIRAFVFPVWGRNPWLKKYDVVLASLPKAVQYKKPRCLIKFYKHHYIKFTIDLAFVSPTFSSMEMPRIHSRLIKIYSIEYI